MLVLVNYYVGLVTWILGGEGTTAGYHRQDSVL
jgi:hypothetical protein